MSSTARRTNASAMSSRCRPRRGCGVASGKLVLEGNRLIADALYRGGAPDFALYSLEHADYDVIAKLQEKKCPLLPVSQDVLGYVSDTQQAPGILAVFYIPKPPLPQPATRVLILDAVREPGNMGTILRTAAAAGVELTILAPGCVDPYNSKVLRAGMSAHFRLPVVEATWAEIAAFCQDLTVFATSADAEVAYTAADWQTDWALILGNEARGVSRTRGTLPGAPSQYPCPTQPSHSMWPAQPPSFSSKQSDSVSVRILRKNTTWQRLYNCWVPCGRLAA